MVSWGAVLSVLIILMVPLSLGVAWLAHVYRASRRSEKAGDGGVAAATPTGQSRFKQASDPVRLTAFSAGCFAVTLTIGGLGVAASTLFSHRVDVEVPLASYWPETPEGVTVRPGEATFTDPSISSAHMTIAGLSVNARLFLAAGSLCNAAVYVALALLLMVLARAVLSGDPFTRTLRRAGWRTALVVLLCGLASPLLAGIGSTMAAGEALDMNGMEGPGVADGHVSWFLPQPGQDLNGSLWPLCLAVGLVLVVELVSAGQRIQAQKAALARDVEGLI